MEVRLSNATKNFPATDLSFSDDGKKIIRYAAQIELGDAFRIADGDAVTAWHALKNFSEVN